MSTLIHWRWRCCFCFVGMAIAASTLGQETPVDDSIRVMSFNIRLGVAKDGKNHWKNRKEVVVAAIENAKVDLVGTQETWDFQAAYLEEQLTEFRYVGRSRQNDNEGEQCGILFRASRFDKLVEGHFWLSETPDRPGSKSWDSALPRMATWLKLWDRVNERSVYVINTHFDHRGQKARVESAKQIRRFVESLPEGSAVIVTGDFNASIDSAPYRALFGNDNDIDNGEEAVGRFGGDPSDTESIEAVQASEGNADGKAGVEGVGGMEVRRSGTSRSTGGRGGFGRRLVDTFRFVHRDKMKQEGTFNGFTGKSDGARIDWVAATENLEVMTAEIDRFSVEGRYPSDHFPVTAKLRFKRTP